MFFIVSKMFKKFNKFIQLGSLSDTWHGGREQYFSMQWIFLYSGVFTLLSWKRTVQKKTRMHHFLQPGGTSNGKKYIYFAYRSSKLSCEGGSIYQGKYTVHTTSKTANQARFKKGRHISAVNARTSHIRPPLSFLTTHLPVATVKEQWSINSTLINRCQGNPMVWTTQNHCTHITHVSNITRSCIDSWRERQDSATLSQ